MQLLALQCSAVKFSAMGNLQRSGSVSGQSQKWIEDLLLMLLEKKVQADLPYLDQLGKPLRNESDVQMEFCQIGFQPPHKQTDALWELFSSKIGKVFKTAGLTLGIDILTMTMVKLCS